MKVKKRDEKEGNESESKSFFLKHGILTVILVIFALALTSGVASATTHVVNQTAPACTAGDFYYATIQAAVNAANPGDAIIVCPEATAYQETVDVNVSDINISAYNATKPVVSANGASDHVFNITDRTNVTLQGFEIRDARGTTQSVAGIYMDNASDCNISDNFVTNISATGSRCAYGIRLLDSNNNTFSSSTTVSYVNSTGRAYGIYLSDSTNNTFSSSTTVSYVNSTDRAYGIYLSDSTNNTFSLSTTVSYVNSTDRAYGIYLWSSNNNTFSSSTTVSYVNSTDRAYGIYLDSTNNTFSSSTTVSYVNSTDRAYGIDLWSSTNNTFSSSTTVSYVNATNRAYGIGLWSSTNNTFSSSTTVSYINATRYVCGIRLTDSTNNTFSSSTTVSYVNATDDAYGIRLKDSNDNTFNTSTSISNLDGTDVYGIYLDQTTMTSISALSMV
jgi:parallel beta-helix repeat protein